MVTFGQIKWDHFSTLRIFVVNCNKMLSTSNKFAFPMGQQQQQQQSNAIDNRFFFTLHSENVYFFISSIQHFKGSHTPSDACYFNGFSFHFKIKIVSNRNPLKNLNECAQIKTKSVDCFVMAKGMFCIFKKNNTHWNNHFKWKWWTNERRCWNSSHASSLDLHKWKWVACVCVGFKWHGIL